MTQPKTRPNRRTTIQARAAALARSPKARVHASPIPKAAEGDTEGGDSTTGSTAELWLYGVVGGFWWGFDAEAVAAALRELPDDVAEVRVRVHSPGGSALEGIAIMNLLANFPAKITVVVDGLAASAASVLILGGDDIVISPGSQVMIHDCSTYTYGNAAQLRSDADWIDKQSANYAEVYATRGGTAESRREAMTHDNGRGTWYTAAEAVASDVNLGDRVGKIESVTPPPAPPSVDDWLDEDEAAAAAAFDRDVLVANSDVWDAWASTTGAMPRAPKPPSASAVGSTETEGGTAVAFSDEQLTNLRAKLGLPETADEAAITAAVEAVVEESLEERPKATAVQVPDGMALVDSAVLKELQDGAKAGVTASQTLASQERDRAIDKALADGKIAATSREKFVEAWDKNADTTRAVLDALTPGLVPTAEVGHESEPNALGDGIEIDDAELDAFAASLGLTKEALRG